MHSYDRKRRIDKEPPIGMKCQDVETYQLVHIFFGPALDSEVRSLIMTSLEEGDYTPICDVSSSIATSSWSRYEVVVHGASATAYWSS